MFSIFKSKKPIIDDQGQPTIKFNSDVLADRYIDELIGLCKGLSADGRIVESEAKYLMCWLERNKHYKDMYPYSILYQRVSQMLKDNILDKEEEKELLHLINNMTGDIKEYINNENKSSSLPLSNPEPNIIIKNSSFVFTGIFTIGTRLRCEEIVVELGGEIHKSITKKTDFLVIGDIGSEHWIHSTHGRKIEKAVHYRDSGTDIKIISEHYFIKFI